MLVGGATAGPLVTTLGRIITIGVLVVGIGFVAVLAAFAAVEPHHQSTWDGVWWAITTMTTVGYGGSPVTTLGRIITIGVLVVGIGFVAVLTGARSRRGSSLRRSSR